jgi:hypothetical protein
MTLIRGSEKNSGDREVAGRDTASKFGEAELVKEENVVTIINLLKTMGLQKQANYYSPNLHSHDPRVHRYTDHAEVQIVPVDEAESDGKGNGQGNEKEEDL